MNIKIKSSDLLTQSIFFRTLVIVYQKKSVVRRHKYELMIKFDFDLFDVFILIFTYVTALIDFTQMRR